MFAELSEIALLCTTLLLPLGHPLTGMALLMSYSEGMSVKCRRKIAAKAAIYTFSIMLVTWLAGAMVMKQIGVSLSGIRIAGGALLLYSGFTLLFPSRQNNGVCLPAPGSNIAFMPIALPGTAGPGVISLVMGFDTVLGNAGYTGWGVAGIAVVVSFLMISFLLWLGLSVANYLIPALGNTRISVLSCLVGFVQFCIGAQFVIDGIKQAFFL